MPRRSKRDTDGLYRRPDSPFWWISYSDGRGGATRRSSGIPVTEDPAGLKAAALRAAWLAAQGEAPTGPDPRQVRTFDELLLAYMREVTPQKGVPERDRYTARHLQPVFTGKPLSQIGVAEVRAYLKSRQAEGAMAGTINKEVGLMSAAINWANRELEWGIPNPWMARRQQEPAGRTRWLTEEEVDRLLTAARAGRAKWHLPAYILLCLHAGLRSNEALHLEWSRVDLGRNRLHLGATDQKNARVSEIPINASARAALIERASFRAAHCPDTPWVFSRRSGIRIGAVKHGFALAVAAAGLKDCHPHDLRRTCGSWLVQAGVGIERVAMILRHSDVRVTARVYAHLRHADLADDITALDRRAAGNKISRDDFTLAI